MPARKPLCGWCGQSDCEGVGCSEGNAMRLQIEGAAKVAQLAVDVLARRTCVFGEEPLGGALTRLEDAVGILRRVVERRDETLAKKGR